MKQRQKMIPEQGKVRLAEALERLVQLYEATDKKDDAAKWRKEMDAIEATEKKGEKQLQPKNAFFTRRWPREDSHRPMAAKSGRAGPTHG